jgi:hypothetical protein
MATGDERIGEPGPGARPVARGTEACALRAHVAFSIAELVVVTLILGAALIPIYSTFVGSSRSVVSSKLGYIAVHVARETVEELRQVPFNRLEEVAAAPLPALGGAPLFASVVRTPAAPPLGPTGPVAPGPAAARLTYPEGYNRIKRVLKVEPVDGSRRRLKKVTLDVTWEETGGRDEKQRTGLMRSVTFIANHSVDPEVPEP